MNNSNTMQDAGSLNQQLMVLAVLIVITVFFVYTRSFKNDVPDCDGYVTNVYLYVLLGLLITAFSVLFIAKRRYAITGTKSLIFLGVALIALFSLYMIDPRNALLNHAVWIVFLVSMSVSVYVIWRYSQLRGTLTSALIITTVMTIALVALATWKPEWIQLSLGTTLTALLLAGILAWIVPVVFGYNYRMTTYYKALTAGMVFLFAIFVLYDTKLLRVKAEKCMGAPDYPTDSLGLFLDIVNIFSGVSRL